MPRSTSTSTAPSDRRPPRPPLWVPGGYLLLGLLSLVGTLGGLAWRPDLLLGGVLAPPLAGLVHLMTLGLVTATILGSLYLVSPFALLARLGEGPGDFVALGLYAVGTAGLVEGFVSGELADAVLSSVLVLPALLWMAVRSLAALARSRISGSFKAPFVLAWTGLAATILLGLLHAVDGGGSLLGGTIADRVAAHAHLGLAGWALVTVMAAGNRLLPMILPAAMPAGPRVWLPPSMVLVGSLLHAAGRIGSVGWATLSGILAMVLGVSGFLASVAGMLRHRRKPPRDAPAPDLPRLGALSALLSLVAATALGAGLALGLLDARWIPAYGVLVLFGFFAQLILAVEQRLVPWLLWMRGYAAGAYREAPPSPYRLPHRSVQALVAALWAAGPWILAIGAAAGSTTTLRATAIAMAFGVALHAFLLARYGQIAYQLKASPEP